jgi:hypothetical protein
MNIKPGLVMGTSGDEVAALHDALTVIGLQIDVTERETRTYGASTVAAVIKLQALAGIEQSGAADENTIVLITVALDRLGIAPGEQGFVAAAAPYAVAGKVTDGDGLPLAQARVRLFDCDLRSSRQIGEGDTDATGAYRIGYETNELLGAGKVADLRVEVQSADGATLLSSPIVFNASRQETINLALGGTAHAKPSEFTSVSERVTPLLGKLTALELEESSEHHDLSFIAGQTGLAMERLGYWVLAARLASTTELPPELFYGLFRTGVPADGHLVALASSAQGVDLQANGEHMLEGVLATAPDTLSAALARALAGNLIPASSADSVPADLERLETRSSHAALNSTQGFGKSSFASVLGALSVETDVQERFTKLYAAATGSARASFWSDLGKEGSFTEPQVSTLRFGVLTGRLTRGFVPLIEELAAQRSSGQIESARDLARLTAAEWMALLEKPQASGSPIGVPSFIDAQTPQLAHETYASMLERFFTRTYPTTAFAARVAADEKTPFVAASATAEFLDANPSFDLRYTNIDAYAGTATLAPEVRTTLLAAQRLTKVNPDYTVMSALLTDGINSAEQLYTMGHDRFVSEYSTLPALGATEASRMWARAEQIHSVSLAMALKYNASLDATTPVTIPKTLPKNLSATVAAFPNLQTLFGSESLCECEECQSVLGDAAYLTDILDFLGERGVTGKPKSSGEESVCEVLLSRRPDIAQIELNCENTDTALPYIDLVNELLEEAVLAPAGTQATELQHKRQTTLSTPELNANPEYLQEGAYEQLAERVYPWTLPFDLPLAEARAYLGQLRLSRAQLITTFQPEAGHIPGQAEALAREQLGLSALQAEIITGAAGYKAWEYWGLKERENVIVDPDNPEKEVSGEWIHVLAEARILLARAGLEYQDLARLLNTIFINGSETVKIVVEPPGSCDVAEMKLEGLTSEILERIHRFVRLWRCLGWDPYDLDNAIVSLQGVSAPGLAQLNDLLLRQLACVAAAMKRYSLSVAGAVALFAPTPDAVTIATRKIGTLPGDEPKYSLYRELFENPAVRNPPDEALVLDEAGTAFEKTTPGATLVEHGAALAAAFEISQSDLTLAIDSFTNKELSLANLSVLYRHVELATALGVTIEELVALLAIVEGPSSSPSGYEPVEPFDGTHPESLARFAQLTEMLAQSGLSIEQADYLLRGVEPGAGLAPEALMVGALLLTLYNGLLKIATESGLFKIVSEGSTVKLAPEEDPAADPTGARIRKAIAGLLDGEDVDTAMAILEGSTTLTASEQEAFITETLGPYLQASTAIGKLLGGGALEKGAPRFEYVLGEVLAYEMTTLSTSLIVQSLAGVLGLETAVATILLTAWFPALSTPGPYVISDFLALASRKLTSTTGPISAADPEFASYFTTYAALAKAALLISTFKLRVEDVNWWRERVKSWSEHGATDGWPDPTKLPPTPQDSAEGRFYGLSRLIAGSRVRNEMPLPNATFASLFSIGSAASKGAYIEGLATATRWAGSTLEVLCGGDSEAGELGLSYPEDYESEIALARLLPCEAILKRTGIPPNLASWIEAAPSGETAGEIKQSVKANYPSEQWLTLAKQLRDPLRQAQRDALVSYLLADEPPAGVSTWLTPDDVFAHFLIDVEMCSCMATSRLVQATAAVQLFVQRCFLGLEPRVTIHVGADENWLQWQWMGQYRVWQANREVFLFPENWIDPTLRPNASPFFTELRQELKQGELNAEAAEAALQSYLEKLEAVARLDVCGHFHDFEEDKDVLRVIARTQGEPPVYYMRKWVDSSHWTAWEKVDLDIKSDHILPVVWNNKRYVFWANVTVKNDQHNQPVPPPQAKSEPPPNPRTHLEVQLAWSQFKQGKWQPAQAGPQTLVFAAPPGALGPNGKPFLGFDSTDITLKSAFNGQLLEIDVFLDEVSTYTEVFEEPEFGEFGGGGSVEEYELEYIENSPRTHVGAFLLGGAGSGVEAFVAAEYFSLLENVGGGTPVDQVGELNKSMLKPAIATPTNTSFDGDWFADAGVSFLSATRPRVGKMTTTYELYGSLRSETVLEQADYYRLIVPHQLPTFDSSLPFFYRDVAREYFLVPTVYFQNGNYFTINAPEYVYDPFYRAEYAFWTFYHPFAWLLVGQLNIGGLEALYAQKLQLEPASVAGEAVFEFESYYKPTGCVLEPFPQEGIDFNANAGYALYNWELFYHVPFLLANALSTNQQFEQAKRWYEYVFTPTGGAKGEAPERFWITKPFNETSQKAYAEQQITHLMEEVNHRDVELEHQVATWRAEPFDPEAIAQWRPVAYQRAIVMHYIDNLIAWGDQLFRQDTMESINLATQLYVLASDLLGPKPEIVAPSVEPEPKTYSELKELDAFSNATVAAENVIPPVKVNVSTPSGSPSLPSLKTLYFQIPPNSQLLGYWDTIAERLYKIRHCMNIEGVVQQLPLFAPPINPALLVAATAAGVDLATVLGETNAALPPYRFRTMIRHAVELCDQVQALGGELLVALEKKDAEALALIRATGEVNLQTATEEVRVRQIEAAQDQIEVLAKAKVAFLARQSFYVNRPLTNEWEANALNQHGESISPQESAGYLETTASTLNIIPTISGGVAGAGGSPRVTLAFGGSNLGSAASAGAAIERMRAAVMQTEAEMSAMTGQFHQRHDDWTLQGTVATDEIARIEAEKVVAEIRVAIATKEKEAQAITLKTAQEVDAFLHEKFTNEELYEWMVSQTSTTYFQAYQLAYSVAKAAEQCFERELAISEGGYIQFGYWDSLHQGLTAGEKLRYDLRRLESAFLTQNDRELEILKHVSLMALDPTALLELRETGSCLINLPEMIFDLDNPGHYMRRLKSIAVTVPCVVGPYTSVSATLTLLNNQIRTSPSASGQYACKGESDPRFVDDPGGAEIVTSGAQNDSGMFELRFEDERYLPFETAGAISTWRLTLNNVFRQFDYSTITDLVLHVRYTARDGGALLREAAVKTTTEATLSKLALAEGRTGLYRMFSARHEFPTNWAQFLNPATGAEQVLTLEIPPERFPFFTSGFDVKVSALDVIVHTTSSEPYKLSLSGPAEIKEAAMESFLGVQGLYHLEIPVEPNADLGRAPLAGGVTPPTWTLKLGHERTLTAEELEDVIVIVRYQVAK